MENLKVLDLLGREIKPGDYVANATHCTSSAYLRRSLFLGLIKKEKYGREYQSFRFKSINISERRKWLGSGKGYDSPKQYICCGNSKQSFLPSYIKDNQITLNVIRLGSFEETFTEDEQKLILSTKTKIKI